MKYNNNVQIVRKVLHMKKISLLMAVILIGMVCVFAVSCTAAVNESSELTVEPTPSLAESDEESVDTSLEFSDSSDVASTDELSEDSAEESIEENISFIGDEKTFFITHYDPDSEPEGAGSIYTVIDAGSSWAHHVAFAPIKGKKNCFEIVDICLGDGGTGCPLLVPEDGFVWAHNQGNNWPVLTEGLTGDGSTGLWYDAPYYLTAPNFVTEYSLNAWNSAEYWNVGDKFYIKGIDLDTFTVPTSTPELAYTDDSYVCTATYIKIK